MNLPKLNRLTDLFFYLTVLLFLIASNFSDNPVGNWYQQFMPNLNGQNIADITFLDSLNGYAITGLHYILKTTNGGDNWAIIYNDTTGLIYKRIQFLNQNTGYVGGTGILKTINGGNSWFFVNSTFYLDDMDYVSQDTAWSVYSENLTGGVFLTTNGGASWQQQLSLGASNPDHIYMFNGRIGFICKVNNYLRKTTDSGMNWSVITGDNGFTDMYFIDSLRGWRAKGDMKKTTDGGLNWVLQQIPDGGNIITSSIERFSNVNRDTIWGVGSYLLTPTGLRGMLDRTTNSGDNWLFQVPDTSIHIGLYRFTKFTSKLNGWAYSITSTGVHTTAGGDPVFYTQIKQISSEIPKQFQLFQNYPNPFNSKTIIRYLLPINGYVLIKLFDILGREVISLVNEYQGAGDYDFDHAGIGLSSGIYFYRMEVRDSGYNLVFTDSKKMIALK